MVNNNVIISDLKNILSEGLNEKLKDIILFGSQITSTSSDDSDYDILVVLKGKPNWELEKKISDLCYEIELKYGIITDTHILGEMELDSLRAKQPVFENALTNGHYL